jgi:hypothetical protein
MIEEPSPFGPALVDERSPIPFRTLFGRLLSNSTELDTAILRVRLSGVDLSERELAGLHRLRILVAEINAKTLEEEAFALFMDPGKRETLGRIQGLLHGGRLELRSAPLAGWSPDFSVFSDPSGPRALFLGLHWMLRPFPHRGPAWLACFGPQEAHRAHRRFEELWEKAHEIGPAVLRLLERATTRWGSGVSQKPEPASGDDPRFKVPKPHEGEGQTTEP